VWFGIQIVWLTHCWTIQKERNNNLFEEKEVSASRQSENNFVVVVEVSQKKTLVFA
jgi:hypothetical protein